MPRGKEIEQLPMSNIAPGAGDDQSHFNRTSMEGIMDETIRPKPAKGQEKTK
ncbi:MAG TPA: hypothetical protein VEY51_07445 [Chondromyces sp.]|nr:hypothetical protein [Chondromyces sp.]